MPSGRQGVVAFYNGYLSATASRAEGLGVLKYVRIDDRWRGGSKCSGEESREREQVELTINGPGGGETRGMSADIHVRHVKREGEPKRNTCVEREQSLCAKVIVVSYATDQQSVLTYVLLSKMKFQICDIVCCQSVLSGRETDCLLEVRRFYVHGETRWKDKHATESLRISARLCVSNNVLSKVVCPCVLRSFVNRTTNAKIWCACYRAKNDSLRKVVSFGVLVEFIMCEIQSIYVGIGFFPFTWQMCRWLPRLVARLEHI